MLIRSGEAPEVGWSRNMLYSGFTTLPRSVVRRQTGHAARITRTLSGSKQFKLPAMKFSILPLLTLVTFASVFMAMFSEHGYFGAALLVPHLLALIFVARSIRRSQHTRAALFAFAFLGTWLITATFGVANTQVNLASQIEKQITEYGDPKRLIENPMRSRTETGEPPWYYINNGGSPCPFVVFTDWGVMAGRLFGSGGRSYRLWVLGYNVEIHNQFHWNS